MDFQSFYKLLDEVMTKKPSGVVPDEDNFSSYVMVRYMSFYDPCLLELINNSVNKRAAFRWCERDPKDSFEYIKSVFPKLPRRYITYQSKPSGDAIKRADVNDEWVEEYARWKQMSPREVRDLLVTADALKERLSK